MRKTIYHLLLLTLLPWSAAYGVTATKGIFSVAENKKVQFANANCVYSDNELIQWANLGAVTEEGWDVLTSAEWSYLLADGRTNADDLNALGTVNDKKGLIILPDGWVQPAGIPVYRTVDEAGIGYEYNVYSAEQWSVMANAGAVFLPCAGYGWMDGMTYKVEDADDHGAYWAKDEFSSTYANCMRFNLGEIHDLNYAAKTNYYSVILVKTVTVLDEEDASAAFATKLAAADDYSYAYVARTMKKDGTLHTLCLPFDVPNIDASPLAGAEVFTFGGGTVSGSTGNEVLHLSLIPLSGKRLSQGVPYLLRWNNTGETMTMLCFYNVENWDDNTSAGADPGNATVKLHGVYPKAHIPGYTSGSVAHYNFFMGANNTLYWPDETNYAGSDMKGFRAYFYIVEQDPDPAPKYRGMQAVWEIGQSATGIEEVQRDNGQWTKVLHNGQIYLMYKGTKYNVQGQKLKDEK